MMFAAKPGEMVLAKRIFQLLAVPDANRKACAVSQNAGFLCKGMYIICIDKNSPVN